MKHLHRDEPGQGLVEYALVLLLLAVVIIISLVLLGPSLGDFLEQFISYLTNR